MPLTALPPSKGGPTLSPGPFDRPEPEQAPGARLTEPPPPAASLDTLETAVALARALSATSHPQPDEPSEWDFLPPSYPQPRSGPFERVQTPPTPAEAQFQHSGWAATRARILASFERTNAPAARVSAFTCCGGEMFVMRHKTEGTYRLRCNRCHDRLCLPCARSRSRLIGANLRKHLTGRHYLHVVLTLASVDAPLADQITKLYRCFRRLRARKFWRKRAGGGAAFCEVTRNAETGRWHPHLHVITEGRFIPHGTWFERKNGRAVPRPGLSAVWSEISGGSPVVWVEAITDVRAAVAEVAKYATKPLSPSLFHDDDALDEFVLAMKGRRLVLPFGTWHHLHLTERSPDWNPDDWAPVMSFAELIDRAAAGEVHALVLLRLFASDVTSCPRPPPGQPRLFPFNGRPTAPFAPSNSTLTAGPSPSVSPVVNAA